MPGVTEWVRRALTELGQDATLEAVTSYIQERDPRVPRSYISLALRKLRLAVERQQARPKPGRVNPAQGELDFPE